MGACSSSESSTSHPQSKRDVMHLNSKPMTAEEQQQLAAALAKKKDVNNASSAPGAAGVMRAQIDPPLPARLATDHAAAVNASQHVSLTPLVAR